MALEGRPDASPASRPGGRDDLLRLFVALIKIALVGDHGDASSWRADARDAQRHLTEAPGDIAGLHRDDLWALAVKTAERDPVVRRDEVVNPMLPTTSPLGVDQLIADPFDVDGAAQTIRDAASFG